MSTNLQSNNTASNGNTTTDNQIPLTPLTDEQKLIQRKERFLSNSLSIDKTKVIILG
jgi:hypothetical protein